MCTDTTKHYYENKQAVRMSWQWDSGHDPDLRPVLVFDNTRENTKDLAGQLRHLVFHVQVRGSLLC